MNKMIASTDFDVEKYVCCPSARKWLWKIRILILPGGNSSANSLCTFLIRIPESRPNITVTFTFCLLLKEVSYWYELTYHIVTRNVEMKLTFIASLRRLKFYVGQSGKDRVSFIPKDHP